MVQYEKRVNSVGFVVEKGRPMPKQERAGKWKTLLTDMAVGESVSLTAKQAKSLYTCAKKVNVKVSMRTDPFNKEYAYVWRVA
jgi:hypothetical protein